MELGHAVDGMKRLIDLLHRVAATDAVALVLGETGVGKEVFARMLHEASPRRERPFIKVDCSSIPENLIESELFGYAPGAFTGAHPKGRAGFFEMAEGGTIFLDEIGDMPLSLQSRLLRVLQDHDLTPLGSSRAKKTNVRVIAATNRDLEAEVRAGTFRSDLYFRLRVAVLTIPPLRDRPDDILPLARHFLTRFCARYRRRLTFSLEAERLLAHYNWPGNVRELENLIEGLVIAGDTDEIGADDLPQAMRVKECLLPLAGGGRTHPEPVGTPTPVPVDWGRPYKEMVAAFEADYLRRAVAECGSMCSRRALPGTSGQTSRAPPHKVITRSNASPAGSASTVLDCWPEISTPASAMTRTARGSSPTGATPAENASRASPQRVLAKPSAIWLRQALPVQTKSTFHGLLMRPAGFTNRPPLHAPPAGLRRQAPAGF